MKKWLVVGGWWLVVGGWWLGVGGWWLVVGGWWLVVSGWWLVVGGWWLVVGGWWLVVGGWWLVVGGWWLAGAMAFASTAWAIDVDFTPFSVSVDPTRELGKMKPVHSTGQGPKRGTCDFSMFRYLKEAGVPYARLHDVGGNFGGNLYVDIPNIFRNFDADENDPKSYDFTFTDLYLKALVDNGVEPYYRLGVTIEVFSRTVKAYRTYPPKDFAKWARICEHIIRHYTEGWANGFRYKITYWEIWNEPDDFPDEQNAMWRGTWRQYCELYETASKHLKAKFPHLKIGGYARCTAFSVTAKMRGKPIPKDEVYRDKCFEEFLAFIAERKCPLDFFSFHGYITSDDVAGHADFHRAALDRAGYPKAELHLNEWLNIRPTADVFWDDARCASPIASFLVALQESKVDIAMVYDARCGLTMYSPLFNPITSQPAKAYYALKYFNELYKLGTEVATTCSLGPQGGEGVWTLAAKDGKGRLAMMVINDSDVQRYVNYDFGGRQIAEVRLVSGSRTDEVVPPPQTVLPRSFMLITFK